ncbi:hypothetical protein DNTS_002168 [Danionella cerebrum]|uniref:Uncharacterized protein n=1 Tax=Danionella cerebrum TaxID=2873325 RepID=A0A553R1G2_9TELE|nr:hypothetical protein DNTS_002168 [Danionella translucida]
MSGCWFGFGFNGFGQICPVESGGQAKVKVSTPELLVSASDCGVKGSWSSRADLHHATCHSEVHLSGFASGSSEIISASSQGCTDALISECFLVLSFTDRVEIWEIQEPQNTRQIWKREHRATDQNDCSLPLVPGGYILPKSPFFRTLSADLCGVSLVLGSEHALLLTAAGMLYSWGSGSHGQLGHGALTSHEDPQVLEALWGVPIRTVAAGNWHSAAVSTGGDLYMWGWNESGQLGLPSRGLEEGKRKTKHSGNLLYFETLNSLGMKMNSTEVMYLSPFKRFLLWLTLLTFQRSAESAVDPDTQPQSPVQENCIPGDGVSMGSWAMGVKAAQTSQNLSSISALTKCLLQMWSVGYGARMCL